jgi:hypothetical protein
VKKLSLKQTAAIFLTVLATSLPAGVRAESGGWFSGISALPLTMRMDSDAGFDGSALSSKNRSDNYGDGMQMRPGNAFSAVPRSWVLGGTGTLSLNERFGLTGKLSSVHTDGDTTSNSVTHGLADALPYNMMGLGMKYDITRSLRFQGGWDRYQLKYNRINGDAGVDLLSIGLKYGF